LPGIVHVAVKKVRNASAWVPTKFVLDPVRNCWEPNPSHVVISSRYIATLQIAAYERLLKKYARGRLLDCGCGTVPYYGIYQELASENYCIDWENTYHSNQFVDQAVDLNGALPFEASSFDTILLSDVLEHLAEPGALVQEIARLLRPEGRVLIMVPFLYNIHEAPFDFYRYTEFALRRFCDRSALKILDLSPYGGYPDVLLDLLNKALIKTEWMAAYYLKVCCWIQRSKRYRRMRESSSNRFPLGYCLAAEKAAQ
jgi:SAM-dependent methyltransferase